MLWCVVYKSSSDMEPLSSTLHGVNTHFIHHLSNVENYLISHKLETRQPKKRCIQVTYFYTFLQIFGLKLKIPIAKEIWWIFWNLANWHLMAQQTAHRWHIQKSKIGWGEHPRIHLWTDSSCNTSIISMLEPFRKVSKNWYLTSNSL